MASKLDHLTPEALRALQLAQDEALRLGHDLLGPEHILLGVLRTESGPVVDMLRMLGVNAEELLRVVEAQLTPGTLSATTESTLTPQAKRTIEQAITEAAAMQSTRIGIDHLLLALARGEEGPAASALQTFDLGHESVLAQLTRLRLRRETLAPTERQVVAPRPTPRFVDLTAAAGAGKLDPLIGRRRELEHLIQILCRRTKRNAVLVGKPGVGKRTIVNGLAQRMSQGEVPVGLLARPLYRLELEAPLSHTMGYQWSANQLEKVLIECQETNAVLLVDNLHAWIKADESSIAAANLLKWAVTRADLQLLGTATLSHYQDTVRPEIEHEWSLQALQINEPSPKETLEILHGVKTRYEQHHSVVLGDDALLAVVQLAARYVPDRVLPAKAIDLMDEAGSHAQLARSPKADELRATFQALLQVRRQRQAAVDTKDLYEAVVLHRREADLTVKLEELRAAVRDTSDRPEVTRDDVIAVVSTWTDIPVDKIAAQQARRPSSKPPPPAPD